MLQRHEQFLLTPADDQPHWVQVLLGHTSIQVTMRYAHLAPGRMQAAVAVLDEDDVG